MKEINDIKDLSYISEYRRRVVVQLSKLTCTKRTLVILTAYFECRRLARRRKRSCVGYIKNNIAIYTRQVAKEMNDKDTFYEFRNFLRPQPRPDCEKCNSKAFVEKALWTVQRSQILPVKWREICLPECTSVYYIHGIFHA